MFWILIDKGALNCVLSLKCRKYLGSLMLVPSHTVIKEYMNIRTHLTELSPLKFLIELGGKTLKIEFELLDAFIDYNYLL